MKEDDLEEEWRIKEDLDVWEVIGIGARRKKILPPNEYIGK
jgi:hypothetical protein